MKLNVSETLRHLEALIESLPAHQNRFDTASQATTFLLRINELKDLVEREKKATLSLAQIYDQLFPHIKATSRRVLFSQFRIEMEKLSEVLGNSFLCVMPKLRERKAQEIPCSFEGEPINRSREINESAKAATADVNRNRPIAPLMATITGSELARLMKKQAEQSGNTPRPLIKFFVSYTRKDKKVNRLLELLRTDLALSKEYSFEFWQDTQIPLGEKWHESILQALKECNFALALVSPSFFSNEYIKKIELPPLVEGLKPMIPVEVEDLDYQRHDLRGLESRQIFKLEKNGKYRSFSQCNTAQLEKEFAQVLGAKIEATVKSKLQRDYLDWISRGEIDLPVPSLQTVTSEEKKPDLPKVSALSEKEHSKWASNITERVLQNRGFDHKHWLDARFGMTKLDEVAKYLPTGEDHYTILLAHQRRGIEDLLARVCDPMSPPFAAVLGESGSGKTTMLQMLAYRMASDNKMPSAIFVDLRDHQESKDVTLEGLLQEYLRRYDTEKKLTPDDIINLIRKQKGVIIFDGLDEKIVSMNEGERHKFIRELWRILPPDIMDQPAGSGRGKMIISCRSHYFPDVDAERSGFVGQDRGSVNAKDYLACIMLPWSNEQIETYFENYLGQEGAVKALETIRSIHNLSEMATRPFLINLIRNELEELEKHRATGIKINGAALYETFVKRWFNRDEGKHKFSIEHKRQMMGQLAADLWRDNAREWPWERVSRWLDDFLLIHPAIAGHYRNSSADPQAERSSLVLYQDFRTATFFLRPDTSAESFRFAHTSIQEFFLARHLWQALQEGREIDWEMPEPSKETLQFLAELRALARQRYPSSVVKADQVLSDLLARESGGTRNAFIFWFLLQQRNEKPPRLQALNLQGLDFSGFVFSVPMGQQLLLTGVNFSRSKLKRAVFERVHMANAKFDQSDLRDAEIIVCDVTGASFNRTLLQGALFRECNLNQTTCEEVRDADGARFIRCSGLGQAWKQTVPSHRLAPWSTAEAEMLKPKLNLQFAGHSGRVTSCAFSGDGKTLASGSVDQTVRLWDVATGECLSTLTGHSLMVTSCALSGDGKTLTSGSVDRTVRLWDVTTGQCLHTLTGHSHIVTSCAFSRDVRTLASGSVDNTVRLWDVTTGEYLRTLTGHSNDVMSCVFSSDGKTLASGSVDRTVRLWNMATGECLHTLTGHTDTVTSCAFSGDGKTLASGSYDKTVRLWDVTTGKYLRTLTGHSNSVTSCAFSSDGKTLASGSYDKTMRLWDAATGECLHTLTGHSDIVTSCAFSGDGKTLVSGSYDKTVRLLEVATGEYLRTLTGYSDSVTSCAFSGDGKTLASGSYDKTVRLWDVTTGKRLHTLTGHSNTVTNCAFSSDGKTLTSWSLDQTVRLWEVATGKYLRSLTGHSNSVTNCAFSDDDQTLSRGSNDRTVCLRDDTGKVYRIIYWPKPFELVILEPNREDSRLYVSGSSSHAWRYLNYSGIIEEGGQKRLVAFPLEVLPHHPFDLTQSQS